MPTKKKVGASVANPAASEPRVAKRHAVKKKTVVKKSATVEHKVHHKYVLLGVCSACDQLPMRANKLVALLSFVIVVLSGMLIYLSAPLDLDLRISWGGGEPIQMDRSVAQAP